MSFHRGQIITKTIRSRSRLQLLDEEFSSYRKCEVIPLAKNTPYVELAENVVRDRDGLWKNPIKVFISKHVTTIGAEKLCRDTLSFFNKENKDGEMDILSICASLDNGKLSLLAVIRDYSHYSNFLSLFDFLGETDMDEECDIPCSGRLIIPVGARKFVTQQERLEHETAVKEQNKILSSSSAKKPFLNSIDKYTPVSLNLTDDTTVLEYDLLTKDMEISTILPYDEFTDIFSTCMRYVTSVEKDIYYGVVRGTVPMSTYEMQIDSYIHANFIDRGLLPVEDIYALKDKLYRSLFELYIIQDLIDDDDITDIKITGPDSIRVRVNGKAYMSNLNFIDTEDYIRFVNCLAVRNNIDLRIATQTFTDESDDRFILRFTITAPYVTGTGIPVIHIRKVSRTKLMGDDLIRVGMFDEKIRDYLIDCGRHSRGIVIAGPPGCGKTVLLNYLIEVAYEASAEMLVIQENDELFAYRKGVVFEHVISNPQKGEKAVSLEDLGKMALVSGANVFIIGEVKGGEICSAITLSNSGCRTALTIHSPSANDTIDKMADLAMRGEARSLDEAKRMIKSFETIVYLKDFKVEEISQIIGYDEEKKDMIYRSIYKRNLE